MASPTVPKVASASTTRNQALDFTKGGLVLLMVLYHWLNYFVPSEVEVYRYLRFLTPAFIFITGFLVSSVYLSRRHYAGLAGRLATRGAKLLAIFAALNLAIGLLVSRSHASLWKADALVNIFVIGNTNVDGIKTAAFYVLVPISYMLLVSAVLLVFHKRWTRIFDVTFIALLFGRVLLDLVGYGSPNLDMLTIGFLGVLLGRVPGHMIERITDYRILLALAYV
ncbi:MAG: acyltransferase family protein, partial [Bryobacteraceae bacterium]